MWVGFCGPIARTGRGSGRLSSPGQRWPKTPSATNLSPFQCVLGYQPVLAPFHQSQIEAPAVDEWFRRSEETCDVAHVRLQWAIRRQKASTDRHRSEARCIGSGSRPETYPFACPAGSWVRGRWWLVRSSSLRCGRFLRPLWTSRGPRRILCEPLWTQGVGRWAFSTSWSGRGTVRRRDAGCRWRTSWTLPYCRNFTVSTWIVLRLVLQVVPEAGVGALLEPCVKGRSCHNFRRSWCLSLFRRRSAVDVTGFLASTDLHFFFHLFCLYSTTRFPLRFIISLFNPLEPSWFCACLLLSVVSFM
ncbi:uncharacterized protein ACWYII_043435 [Salvelinus alpinus]